MWYSFLKLIFQKNYKMNPTKSVHALVNNHTIHFINPDFFLDFLKIFWWIISIHANWLLSSVSLKKILNECDIFIEKIRNRSFNRIFFQNLFFISLYSFTFWKKSEKIKVSNLMYKWSLGEMF